MTHFDPATLTYPKSPEELVLLAAPPPPFQAHGADASLAAMGNPSMLCRPGTPELYRNLRLAAAFAESTSHITPN